ncbi:MAG: UPF0280 family protein [Pseudoruegeria sp.]
MSPTAVILPCGTRLHLQHGPIDLIISADGQRDRAFEAANARFQTILTELVSELDTLRQPMTSVMPYPNGETAQRMHQSAIFFTGDEFFTRMAAVAGAVADTVLHAMTDSADLKRAYVNNGGDIALHLESGERYSSVIASHDGRELGQIVIQSSDKVGGIATSGRHGRSLSRGIADSVTVLSSNATNADLAATLIANAVDLRDHPTILRRPANVVVDDSDLGTLPVVTSCGRLSALDRKAALRTGLDRALDMIGQNSILGAALYLQGEVLATDTNMISSQMRTKEYA